MKIKQIVSHDLTSMKMVSEGGDLNEGRYYILGLDENGREKFELCWVKVRTIVLTPGQETKAIEMRKKCDKVKYELMRKNLKGDEMIEAMKKEIPLATEFDK